MLKIIIYGVMLTCNIFYGKKMKKKFFFINKYLNME